MNLAIKSDIFKSNKCNTNITMATITVRIPDKLKEQMDSLDEINWSSVIRNMLEEKVYHYYVLHKIKIAEEQIKEGKFENFEDVMDELEKKYNSKSKK